MAEEDEEEEEEAATVGCVLAFLTRFFCCFVRWKMEFGANFAITYIHILLAAITRTHAYIGEIRKRCAFIGLDGESRNRSDRGKEKEIMGMHSHFSYLHLSI